MSIVVAIIVIGGIVSISVGLIMSVLTALSVEHHSSDEIARAPLTMDTAPVFWSFTIWTIVLGLVLIFAPQDWFGPSWSYFRSLPHNGFGMGVCLLSLSTCLGIALWRKWSARSLAVLFFATGFIYWTAGMILGAEGLVGHEGLMEAPFMMYVGGHAFSKSAVLAVSAKK